MPISYIQLDFMPPICLGFKLSTLRLDSYVSTPVVRLLSGMPIKRSQFDKKF